MTKIEIEGVIRILNMKEKNEIKSINEIRDL